MLKYQIMVVNSTKNTQSLRKEWYNNYGLGRVNNPICDTSDFIATVRKDGKLVAAASLIDYDEQGARKLDGKALYVQQVTSKLHNAGYKLFQFLIKAAKKLGYTYLTGDTATSGGEALFKKCGAIDMGKQSHIGSFMVIKL